MPIIPMKQTCKVLKKSTATDGWGRTIPTEPLTLKCRFTEEQRALRNNSTEEDVRNVRGIELSPKGKVFFDRLVDITIDDMIEFTDELGRTKRYKPLMVGVVRGPSGRPMHTVVTF